MGLADQAVELPAVGQGGKGAPPVALRVAVERPLARRVGMRGQMRAPDFALHPHPHLPPSRGTGPRVLLP
jgi:hypothetical protein